MAEMGAKIAKHQPRKPESCDNCVGQLIQWGFPQDLIDEESRNKRTHGPGEHQVLLVNYLVPGHGTQQATLCKPCRYEVFDLTD